MFTFVAAALALSSAVSVTAISGNCTSGLATLSTTQAGQCLDFTSALGLIATVNTSQSIVQPLDSYVAGLCGAQPTCSNDTLSNVGTVVRDSCQSDLQSAKLPSDVIQNLPAEAQQYYPALLKATCTRDESQSNSLCLTLALRQIEQSKGNITGNNIVSQLTSVLSDSNLEKSLVCSSCGEAMYAAARPSIPTLLQGLADAFFTAQCGSSFNAGATPSNVVIATGTLASQTTGATSSGGANGHSSASALGVPSSALSSLFALVGAMTAGAGLLL